MYVGTVIEHEEHGTGVCLQVAERKKKFVGSFMFQHGNIVVYSLSQMNEFLTLLGNSPTLETYTFQSTDQAQADFKVGVFNDVFQQAEYEIYSKRHREDNSST